MEGRAPAIEPGSNGRLNQAYVNTPDGIEKSGKQQSVGADPERARALLKAQVVIPQGTVRKDFWRHGG